MPCYLFRETNSFGSRGVRSVRARSTPIIHTTSPTEAGANSAPTASTRRCRAVRWTISFQAHYSSASRGGRRAPASSTPAIRRRSLTGAGANSAPTASTRRFTATPSATCLRASTTSGSAGADVDPGHIDDGYPAPISDWGWGEFGAHGIDAALNSGAFSYFFAGDHYIRVSRGDVGRGRIEDGYPAPISDWGWGPFGASGISAALFSGIDFVVPAPAPHSGLGSNSNYIFAADCKP
jgi:Hemopexin